MRGEKLSTRKRKSSRRGPPSPSPVTDMASVRETTKKKKEPRRHAAFLPTDVWVEILLRIPAEDLVKLKFVCKSWCELITSQSFARLHLDHWMSRPSSGFAVHADCVIDGRPNSSILYFTLHLNREGGNFQCRNILIRDCYRRLTVEYRLLASCDGLLLIGYSEEGHCHLVICNPITGTHRSLPIFQPSDNRLFWHFNQSILVDYEWAMVRNASSGQYKVFGMETHPKLRRACHVFELQRDSEEEQSGYNWKELDTPLPNEWTIETSTATGGKVHWFACMGEPLKVKILSIDILTDELSTSASIELLPGMDLCSTWNGTYYCTQPQDHELRLWALENFDKPTWVEKDGSVCHNPPWSSSMWTEQFDLPGGVKLVIEESNWDFDVILKATDTGISNCLISWNAEKVVPHVNSLIGFS